VKLPERQNYKFLRRLNPRTHEPSDRVKEDIKLTDGNLFGFSLMNSSRSSSIKSAVSVILLLRNLKGGTALLVPKKRPYVGF
jgi:hypothetical protein